MNYELVGRQYSLRYWLLPWDP